MKNLHFKECSLQVSGSNLYNKALLTANVRFIGIETLSRKFISLCTMDARVVKI